MRRETNKWSGGYLEWIQDDIAYISVVFSWKLPKARKRAIALSKQGFQVIIGGPATALMPGYLTDVAQIGGNWSGALQLHNPSATRTSIGCTRMCPFCIVPRTEGGLKELTEWPLLPIACDNNLLACSYDHFDHVIDRYLASEIYNVDFNQGLDARLLTLHHAEGLLKLHRSRQLKITRLAWDYVGNERAFREAHKLLVDAGIPKSKIGVYVLIGYNDTSEDALYRLETIWHELGSWPFPMRYQPIDTLKKNSYVAPNWTHQELQRYVRYWSALRFTAKIPFSEFKYGYKK
jgi:hypothetical protein